MKKRILLQLARMPVRDLYLAMGAIPLIAVVLLAIALRPQFTTLKTVRAELVNQENNSMEGSTLHKVSVQMAAEVEEAARQAMINGGQRNSEQVVFEVMDELGRSSKRHNLVLASVSPSASRKVLLFDELAFNIEASGGYHDVIAWVRELESRSNSFSVSRLEARQSAGAENLSIKLSISVYQESKAGK